MEKLRKLIKEEIQNIISDSAVRIKGHTFMNINGTFVGGDGILGVNDKLIPWDRIMNFYKRYNK